MKPFYVYRIFNEYDDTLYIGKGSGNRLEAQKRRFGFFGEKLRHFVSEDACLKEEIRLIAKFKPPFNKTAGGERGGYAPEINDDRECARLMRRAHQLRQALKALDAVTLAYIKSRGREKCEQEFRKYNIFLKTKAVYVTPAEISKETTWRSADLSPKEYQEILGADPKTSSAFVN